MKGKKLSLWMSGLMMMTCLGAMAQQKITGIYLTSADYIQNKMTYTETNGHLYKARLYALAPKDHILLTHGGEQTKLEKDRFFALQLKDGKIFHMKGGESYELLNRNPQLFLYRRKLPVSPKTYPEQSYRYYFSTGENNLQELTTRNIKQAFVAKKDLPERLDAAFRDNDDLMAYDTFHHMYKLEWLIK
ncbi:hypothetical protein HHL17_23780 [Chitinophaga sp. G-6-1-13]|uniref:DUF4369 domain-containing protein n=1 Tax=Chitinophaga fulva TaxID=2728842 RepID=A0A848GRV3_9BACT|nr:hypothetical protein [Chitinophaga fulva]NML40241.1 hypothetical protein [Chitinophaga fulva]